MSACFLDAIQISSIYYTLSTWLCCFHKEKSPTSVAFNSRTIHSLTREDLAVREEDPEDRRFIKILLTTKGQQQYKDLETGIDRYYSRILESIPVSRQQEVRESLQLLLEILEDQDFC